MCKYCKKLKEIKDLDEKCYLQLVNIWRRRDVKSRRFLEKYKSLLNLVLSISPDITVFSSFELAILRGDLSTLQDYLNEEWIGK